MNKVVQRIVAGGGLLLLLLPVLLPINASAKQSVSRYIVQFDSRFDSAREARGLTEEGFNVAASYRLAINGVAVDLPATAAEALKRNPKVISIELDREVTAYGLQNPVSSWGLDRVDQRALPLDNSYSYGDSVTPVKIYVFDTGLNSSLSEFSGRVLSGRNFLADQDASNTNDCNGHGTHVSGTALGSLYGVNKFAQVIPVRVLDCQGSGTGTGLLAGIDWVMAQHNSGPAVANFSLGFGGIVSSVDKAINNLINDGVLTVVAAGNSNKDACNYTPARVGAALTVGATTSSDSRSSFSNFGGCLDLFAPGSSITSLDHRGAAVAWNGTSMASPHVAGAAALIWAENTSASLATVVNELVSRTTTGALSSIGRNSPNRLLYLAPPASTPPASTTPVVEESSPPPATDETQVSEVPGVPTEVKLTSSGRTLTGNWSAPTGATITGYRVALFKNGNFAGESVITSGTTLVVNVTPGTWQIQVRAYNGAGIGSPASSNQLRVR